MTSYLITVMSSYLITVMSSYLITVMSSYLITVMSSYLITVANNCCSSSLACATNRCAHMMLGAEQYFVRKFIFLIIIVCFIDLKPKNNWQWRITSADVVKTSSIEMLVKGRSSDLYSAE